MINSQVTFQDDNSYGECFDKSHEELYKLYIKYCYSLYRLIYHIWCHTERLSNSGFLYEVLRDLMDQLKILELLFLGNCFLAAAVNSSYSANIFVVFTDHIHFLVN